MSASPSATTAADRYSALEAECRKEHDHTHEQLSEIQLLLQQTTIEADRLGQREATINGRVRDMEINLENYTRSDIKTLYTSATEVGLRLFMMRSQVEQLQMRYEHVKERQEQLGIILDLLSQLGVQPSASSTPSASAASTREAGAVSASLGRIIEAQETERQRVSRYLHDGPAQMLTNLVLKAEICEHMIDRDAAEAKAELQGLRTSLTASLQETRRLIFDLRPMILDDIGLVPTLRRYLTEVGRGRGFSHTVRGSEGDDQLAPPVRAMLFRLVQDVVGALGGDGAVEQVAVDLVTRAPELELTITVRATAGKPPPTFDQVLTEDHMIQRLRMLAATTEVGQVGEHGAQLVVIATPPLT